MMLNKGPAEAVLYIKILRSLGIEFSDEKNLCTKNQTQRGYFILSIYVLGISLASNFCRQNIHDWKLLVPAVSMIIIAVINSVKGAIFFTNKHDFFLLMKRLGHLRQLGKSSLYKLVLTNYSFLFIDLFAQSEISTMNTLLSKFFRFFYILAAVNCFSFLSIPSVYYVWQVWVVGNKDAKRFVPIFQK